MFEDEVMCGTCLYSMHDTPQARASTTLVVDGKSILTYNIQLIHYKLEWQQIYKGNSSFGDNLTSQSAHTDRHQMLLIESIYYLV